MEAKSKYPPCMEILGLYFIMKFYYKYIFQYLMLS